MPAEGIPFFVLYLAAAGELVDSIVQAIAQRVFIRFDAVHRDNGKMSRHAGVPGKIEQRGDQFPPGQIARAAEDHKYGGLELLVRLHDSQSTPIPGPSCFGPNDPARHTAGTGGSLAAW